MDVDFSARGPPVAQSTIQQLIDQYLGEFKGAIVNHVTTQCQDQGRLLEEANRDLDVFKKAYYRAECGMQDHKARFELEKQTLRNEIRKFKAIEAREKRPAVLIDAFPHLASERKRTELEGGFPGHTIRDHLVDVHHFAESFEEHAATRCRDQGQLLEESRRDLEVFKRAYHNAEREIRDLEERYRRKMQVLNNEIHRLREHELHCREGRFERTIVYQATQCQCQGRLLDEAKRDLEALKKAQYKADRDMYHLEERFERELGAANREIRHLRAIVAHEKRAVDQQIHPAAPADTRRYAAVWEGTKTA